MTRKAMQSTIKKVEEEKIVFEKRQTNINEEVAKIKKHIELLPMMLEEDMNEH